MKWHIAFGVILITPIPILDSQESNAAMRLFPAYMFVSMYRLSIALQSETSVGKYNACSK